VLPTDIVNQLARDRICERRTAADAWRLARFARTAAEETDGAPRWRLLRRRRLATTTNAGMVAPTLTRAAAKFAGDCGP
jgi:hypothetical protein